MSELNFFDTNAAQVLSFVMEELENSVNEPLYPGDERRIFGESFAQLVVAVYNVANDKCRQRLLRYARGPVLDALGENRDVERITPTQATTTLIFGVDEAVSSNIIIPAGIRVTSDFVHYFVTDVTAVLYAGSLTAEVTATAESGGNDYNDIAPGALNKIVDVSDIPLIDYVSNIEVTAGGGDEESDDAFRERIRTAENRLSTAGTAKAYRYWALSANPRVTDAAVVSETETVSRTLKTYAAHVFQGGANLLPDTLLVYLPDGSTATAGVDYTATYEDELLTLTLSGGLANAAEVKIDITRIMYGRVKIVPICAGGELPDEEVLADVMAACSADDVRAFTDLVLVEAPAVETYDIELTYYTTKANESEAVRNVEGSGGAIDQYIQWQSSALDLDINPDELRKLIYGTGVGRVDIVKPVHTDLGKTTVAKFSGNIKVQHVTKG